MSPRGGKTGGSPAVRRATNSIDRTIAKQIKHYRTTAGLTAEVCAETIGVSPQEYELYERGTARIPASHLVLLSTLLRVPVAAFLERPSVRSDASSRGNVVTMPSTTKRQEPSPDIEDRLLKSFRAIKYGRDKQMVADLAARLAENCCSASRG